MIMPKHSILFIIISLLLSLEGNLYAQSMDVIKLNDGSILQGQVLELKDSVYTVQTSNLGAIKVPQENVVTIAKPDSLVPNEMPSPAGNTSSALQSQVQNMQGNILANPEIMEDVKKLLENPEVMSILSDKNFINDMLTYDQKKIESNQKTQELFNNPQIQSLIQKINQTMPQNQDQPAQP